MFYNSGKCFTDVLRLLPMKTFHIILRKSEGKAKTGNLKIRVTENRKSVYYNLNIKLEARLWNPKTQRIRQSDEFDYRAFNNEIETKLAEIKIKHGAGIDLKKAEKQSLITYFQSLIDRITNQGSKIKWETVLVKLKKFLSEKGLSDLLFVQLTTDLIYEYRKYLLTHNISNNTTNHYLKFLKMVVNRADEEGVYVFYRNPFKPIKFSYHLKLKRFLSENELFSLLSSNIPFCKPILFKARIKFLFQVYAQGMRVSDLQLIRWNMIYDGRLNYTMFKTQKFMSIFLNHNLKILLFLGLPEEIKNNYGSNFDGALQELSRSKIYRNRFIFDFLSDNEFGNINENNDFSKINTSQYLQLKHNSIVYNRQLKYLQAKANIATKLTTHVARYTFTNLLLQSENVDLMDISKSLGHANIKVTESYISGFSQIKVDKAALTLSEKFKILPETF